MDFTFTLAPFVGHYIVQLPPDRIVTLDIEEGDASEGDLVSVTGLKEVSAKRMESGGHENVSHVYGTRLFVPLLP